ncbi:hypothetical protein AB28_3786 [Raoultella ornithinolytica 2-156-04_S1_C2]|nr:hypothetical protein AB00_3780 [Raoultella ornithinolytica 2-156-04_S1_C1]KDX12545.1 hypothetical protein AB28_3786 [Raoultella ornithinolytica 2-156-04_S1_C2]
MLPGGAALARAYGVKVELYDHKSVQRVCCPAALRLRGPTG